MDTVPTELHKAKELVDKAKDILIVTHENPSFDSMGSSLALYLGLVSLAKRVTIACPDAVTVEFSNFIGVNKVVQEIAKKNFVISLEYVEGSIEKVSYNIEGNRFNLVIEPRPGFEPFTKEKVHFSNSGMSADLIIAVGTIHLGGLKKLYDTDQELFANQPIVNIDRHPNNARFGSVNLIDGQASSTAEVTAQLLSVLGVKLTQDIATNLLNALYSATVNFQSTLVSGRTFDLAAVCIKAGGRRFQKSSPREEPRSEKAKTEPELKGKDVKSEDMTVQEDQKLPAEVAKTAEQPKTAEPQGAAPADWLKPKIFKSSQNV